MFITSLYVPEFSNFNEYILILYHSLYFEICSFFFGVSMIQFRKNKFPFSNKPSVKEINDQTDSLITQLKLFQDVAQLLCEQNTIPLSIIFPEYNSF